MDLDAEPSTPTPVHLPPTLPYPITISALHLRPSTSIAAPTKAISYTYQLKDDLTEGADVNTQVKGKKKGGERGYASWDCAVEGEVVGWGEGMNVGTVLRDASKPIIHIQRPCAHPVQFHGMCAICGADLVSQSHTAPTAPSTSTSTMTNNGGGRTGGAAGGAGADAGEVGGVEIEHNESGVRVSLEHAHSLALAHRTNLLNTRKLILIIDLDQTIIQTGCDLTTGQWMDECYGPLWGLVEIDNKGRRVPGSRDPHVEVEGEAEEVKKEREEKRRENPNAEAIKDVWRFKMDDEDEVGVDALGRKWVRKGRQGVWFFVKPRPGLSGFLQKMSEMFELHVYTAGTRTYANAICSCIDPTGKLFSERILSRNESGSASTKSLKRLFPTDESMVVVIDDRWEVWAHGKNLVKVIPYAFYPNTGDINSAFVEPRATDVEPITRATPDEAAAAEASTSDDPELEKKKRQSEAAAREVEIQVEEAPLAKRQEELDRLGDVQDGDVTMVDGKKEETAQPQPKRAALIDNDRELRRVDKVLREVHARFYQTYDSSDKTVAFRPASEPSERILYDVRHIIPHMRKKVFSGCVICFSGVIPLQQRPEENEFWLLATLFGAKCQRGLDPKVTHLVVAQADTQKVAQAFRMPNTIVVWREWLKFSVDFCVRQPEEPYQVEPPQRPISSLPRTPSKKGKERAAVDSPVATSPPTPAGEEPPAVKAGDFDDVDAELEEFMGSDDDDDDEDESMEGSESGRSEPRQVQDLVFSPSAFADRRPPDLSPLASPISRKRPRKTQMSETSVNENEYDSSPTDSEEDGVAAAHFSPETGLTAVDKPVTKRARISHDAREEHDTQYADVKEEMRDEDWDEYADEGNASELEDGREEYEPKDLPDDEDDDNTVVIKNTTKIR